MNNFCECKEIGKVARDTKSTCMKCGGIDAYKTSKLRGEERRMIMKWISVEDSLPDKRAQVLVVVRSGDVFDNHYFDGRKFKLRHFDDVTVGVTHWMLLPEAPKVGL